MYTLFLILWFAGLSADDEINRSFQPYNADSVRATISRIDFEDLSDFNKARVRYFQGYESRYHRGLTGKALTYYLEALSHIKKTDNRLYESVILNALGGIFHQHNRLEEAKKFYREAFENSDDYLKCDVLFKLGLVSRDQENYQDAADQFTFSMEYATSKSEIWRSKVMIAECFEMNNELDSAFNRYQEVVNDGSTRYVAQSMVGMGSVLSKKGEHDSAIAKITEAIEISESDNLFDHYMTLGESLERASALPEAIQAYNQAMENDAMAEIYKEEIDILLSIQRLADEIGDSETYYQTSQTYQSKSWAYINDLEEIIKQYQSYQLDMITIRHQEKIKEIERNQMWIRSISALGVVTVLIILIWYRSRTKLKKSTRNWKDMKDEISNLLD